MLVCQLKLQNGLSKEKIMFVESMWVNKSDMITKLKLFKSLDSFLDKRISNVIRYNTLQAAPV